MKFISSFFSNQKIINSEILNILGIQVLRVVAFRIALIASRWWQGIDLLNELRPLSRDGIICLSNYLPKDQFEAARMRVYALISDERVYKWPKYKNPDLINIINIKIERTDLPKYPELAAIFDSPHLVNAVSYLSGKKSPCVTEMFVELIRHRDGEIDNETSTHADTFFANQNAWYFLEDCPLEAGPFFYAKGTHRVTPMRLVFQYVAALRGMRGESGSARVTPGFQNALKVESLPVEVKANTLLISNNFGFHSRGVGYPGTERLALKISLKETPFSRNLAT